ncbi:hypothetical protein NGR_c11520 [Sinorhizobium fredii NGR234]|uniref:Uncharacterized protein n=1 Tax=Sinorhizobium fredii (strain NBRC 101917 / NGR234) TaxID=394 RepID=C3MAU4_SINFN|nr:hypothetical protein [Sinorhizobium fredii]ACP24937.1 hypothetical protein NGR_c11520 [Sinorhizobium fredii NGR234]
MPRAGAWWLSEFVGRKIQIECECGVKKQYDARAMLKRIGDRSMPTLLTELAIANGCVKTGNKFYDRCRLVYQHALPDQDNKLSRWNRPTVRRRPALPRRSPSQTFRNGMTCSAAAADAAVKAGSIGARWLGGSGQRGRYSLLRGTCTARNAATRTETSSRLAESADDAAVLDVNLPMCPLRHGF